MALSLGLALTSVRNSGETEPSAPSVTTAISWDETPRVGRALSFTVGSASGFPSPTSQFTLYDDDPDTTGVVITGPTNFATMNAYTPVAGNVGDTLYLRQTFTNSEGSATSTAAAPGATLTDGAVIWYAAETGGAATNAGTIGSPLRQPSEALAQFQVGDTLRLRTGTYEPFEVPLSGTIGSPILIETEPGEERLAIIEGDLQDHISEGGAGVTQDNDKRDGIYIASKKYIEIHDLTLQWVFRAGIWIIGDSGTATDTITIDNCLVQNTGAAGIAVFGQNPSTVVPLANEAETWTDNVIVENCDVLFNNRGSDFTSGTSESISVAALADNTIVRNNTVGHASTETLQYGIDYKAGVTGGSIYGNTIQNMEKYGIYLDAGRRHVENVAVYNNTIIGCRNGIVLAREAAASDYATEVAATPAEFIQTLSGIDIYNNIIDTSDRIGIYCQRHPRDGPDGAITNVRIRFNTVYNADRDTTYKDINLSGWADADFLSATVVSGFEFVGNLVYNSTESLDILDEFTGASGFTVEQNAWDNTDPLFADAASDDFNPATGGGAEDVVDLSYTASPFNLDADGVDRTSHRTAGALIGTTAAVAGAFSSAYSSAFDLVA